jgi:formylglycine-generating enzyme required for sulfatase activity
VGAIFISYTGRDRVGSGWADHLVQWFGEWSYGFFRDNNHSNGIKVGAEWRQALRRELRLAQVLVCLYSDEYDSSPWCVSELAIALEKGKTVIPILLLQKPEDRSPAAEDRSQAAAAETLHEERKQALNQEAQEQPKNQLQEQHRQELQQNHADKLRGFQLLLGDRQAIEVHQPSNPSPEQLQAVKDRLRTSLDQALKWRALQQWDASQSPYPGLPAFEEKLAPVFFGRDRDIEAVCERASSEALQAPAFLLLLGASGYGKSSLLRAGVVPRLRADGERWLPLNPFRPGQKPFDALAGVMQAAGWQNDGSAPLTQLQRLQANRQRTLVLVIDQFEELLVGGTDADGQQTEADRFLAFLQELLGLRAAGLLVLATMRIDFMPLLQNRCPDLLHKAQSMPLRPIMVEDFAELIEGPAARSGLDLETGLKERLVGESEGPDSLPLLAFTLEKLWRKRQGKLLKLAAYEQLNGVEGAVSSQAQLCWNPATGSEAEATALRQAFLNHLVTLNEQEKAAKRPARLQDLPEPSRPIIEQMVQRRLLVSYVPQPDKPVGPQNPVVVEIAHEALLRTWEPLKQWIEADMEELLQRRRVRRLGEDLKAEAPQQRRQALETLASLAAAGGSEGRAVHKEATEPLEALLTAADRPLSEREDAALVLALIAEVEPLQKCLADIKAPVALRRRAAESLGLLAKRSGDPKQREAIATDLEGWLRGEALDVLIEVEFDAAKLDPAEVQGLVEETQRQVAEGMEQALQSGQIPAGMGEDELQQLSQMAFEYQLMQRLKQLEQQVWAEGKASGWAEHDGLLPLLQGASRGLQLAASADLPLFGSGPGLVVPMLTLTALEEGSGLRIRTEVVEVPLWQLPLPGGEQLELVLLQAADYKIGSPAAEEGRTVYSHNRSKCDPGEVDVEARRTVRMSAFALVRQPISQAQWRAVVEGLAADKRGNLKPGPGTFRGEDLWERHGQPGGLPVDSVSWNASREWLQALNGWLADQWPSWVEDDPAMAVEPVRLELPSESQWEAACRADTDTHIDTDNPTPFHFGATLDASWARYDASYTYGKGRRGEYDQRPVPIGFFGLVNRWGLAELHGQLSEWCGDQWHRDPVTAAPAEGAAIEGPDPGLVGDKEQRYRLLRGGSWFNNPLNARAAFRISNNPDVDNSGIGLRPCCPSPPGSLLGS